MHYDLHLDVGTRVINNQNGRLGKVTTAHYLCRCEYHEICVNYDGDHPESGMNEDRAHIEYEGSPEYAAALARWHPPG